jgi:hypothetical protein
MKSEYRSGKSVGKNQTVPIPANERRLRWDKQGQHRGRQGAEIQVIGLDTTLANQTLYNNLTMGNSVGSAVVTGSQSYLGSTVIAYGSHLGVYPGGSGPYILVPTDPTNVSATWIGNDLKIEFDFDITDPVNIVVSQFIISLTANGVEHTLGGFAVDRSQTHQTLLLTKTMNIQMFNIFTPKITGICVKAADPLNNISKTVCAVNIPSYVLDLNKPVISEANVNNGYTITVANTSELAKGSFDAIDIWEIESDSSSAPAIVYAADGYTPTNYQRVYFSNMNPALVISPNLKQRYVIVRFSSVGGIYTSFADPVKANPTTATNVDQIPPNEVTNLSAAWNGDDLNVSFKMPQTDGPVRVVVQLQAVSNSAAYGYFYFNTDNTSKDTITLTITKRNMYLQLGQYYSSFNVKVSGYDAAGNLSGGAQVTTPTRTNPMSSVQASATITAQPDGYAAVYDFSGTSATHAELYEFYTDTVQNFFTSDLPDYYKGSWASGGSANSTTLTLTSVTKENETTAFNPTQYIGYTVSGFGIPVNTHVVSISGSGPTYTFTLNNPLSDQAQGNYLFTGLIYSGGSPASIYSAYYQPRWVVVVWYDDFDNNSIPYVSPGKITPIDPGAISLINNPVTFSTNGSILAGDSATSTPRAVLNKTGLYVYDAAGNQTTKILGNASGSSATFFTTRAQIADWSITSSHIQNDLAIVGSKNLGYVGLSGTNASYAFWAGSGTSDNSDNSAKFSVSPSGAVVAKSITIVGSGSGTLINAGDVFTVTNSGTVTITGGAEITGKLHVSGGSTFDGNVTVGSGGSISSGTVGATSGNAGYVLDTTGLKFDNGTTQGITQIVASTGKLITKSASIGSWNVNDTSISRVSSTGHGTITLDAANGYISVSDASVSGYTAGINGPSTTSDTVFWAGTGGATGSNNFRVTLDGSLYATSATITGGTIVSQGNSINSIKNKVTIDGPNDLIKFSSGTNNAYIIPRNNNLYITAPSSTDPWSGSTTPGTSTASPTNAPYFAAGSSFKDSWGNTSVSGIGIYTGAWDYFSAPYTSSPFITATTTGLQLSAGPQIGMIMETGGKANSVLANAGVLIYTAQDNPTNNPTGTPTYGPSTKYGAYLLTEPKKITIFSNNPDSGKFPYGGIIIDGTTDQQGTFIYAGDSSGAQQAYAGFNKNGITLQAATSKVQEVITKNTITIQSTNGATGGDIKGVWTSSDLTIQANDTVKGVWNSTSIKMQSTSDIYGTWDSTGIKIQTSTSTYGSWTSSGITFQSGTTAYTTWDSNGIKISPSSSSNTYMQIDGSSITATTTIASGYYVGSDGAEHTQAQTQLISLAQDGLHIHGLSVYGNDTRLAGISSTSSPFTRVIQYAPSDQTYGNTKIKAGDAVTGFAIYYGNHSPVGTEGASTGFSGDFWVQI